jgi:hypothetical protein
VHEDSSGGRTGPRVLYSNQEDGIAIIDRVDDVPFPATTALVQLPATLRRLHMLPPVLKPFNYATAHHLFIWRLRGSGLFPKARSKRPSGGAGKSAPVTLAPIGIWCFATWT